MSAIIATKSSSPIITIHYLFSRYVISQSGAGNFSLFISGTQSEYVTGGKTFMYLNEGRTNASVSFTAPETGRFTMIVGFGVNTPMRTPTYSCSITADTTTYEKINNNYAVYSVNITKIETISVYVGAGQTNHPVTGTVLLIKQ